MEKVIVIGSNGLLGTDICKAFKDHEVIGLTHKDIEISSLVSCIDVISHIKPSIIINATALGDVEKCEENLLEAYKVNAIGPGNLATIAKVCNSKLVHISTDYVFDGKSYKPYTEDDLPGPLNAYGITKLSGEHFVASRMSDYFIFRTSALYGDAVCRSKNAPNFVDRMIELSKTRDNLRVVDDEIVSPTSTKSLAEQILLVACSDNFGLYHATSNGMCSWYQFVNFIFYYLEIGTTVEKASPGEFSSKVNRPAYSVLDNANLRRIESDIMPEWKDSVVEYLHEKENNE